MQHLFRCWGEVSQRLRASRNIALFLDFDGTLAAIAPRPELVHVPAPVRRTLAKLAERREVRVWVISARRRADLRHRLRVPCIGYLGLYGWERGALPPAGPGPMACLRAALANALAPFPAVWIEDKEYTLAVHTRGAPEGVRRLVAECVFAAVERWRGRLRIVPGKCVWEVVDAGWGDKGAAVRRELGHLRHGVLPVYVGDDLSDEAGFAALPEGIAIRVGGRGPTRARYRLDSAAQVHRFLEKLRDTLP